MIVIGAGPGIAGATARRFGRDGYDVALVARDADRLTELGEGLQADGITAGWAPADAGDAAALTRAIGLFTAHAGPADVLLYNAVGRRQTTAADLTPEELAADLAAGVIGLQTAVQAVLPGMRERGSGTVLVTGGGAADDPRPAAPSLGVQKAALRALVTVLAEALAPEGIHVATATVRGLVRDDGPIRPVEIAELYAELVAETAGPREQWRTVVDVT
nr:SDR family NAD(P)-dependent oxidoreductase [Petropleomorpha daqingensis]